MKPIAFDQSLKPAAVQMQRLMLSAGMQQALHVLQLPIEELAAFLEGEIDHALIRDNESMPEWRSNDHNGENFAYQPSLFEHLMQQVRLTFTNPEDLKKAEWIVGNLDDRGFLSGPIDAAAEPILQQLQLFDPPGIAARSLQDSLLIQLRIKGKNGLAYQLIAEHYDDLLHNRIPLLQKKLGCSYEVLKKAIAEDIVPLNLKPAGNFTSTPLPKLTPDLSIHQDENDAWIVEVNEDPLPKFRVSDSSGKWLQRNIERRHETLRQIGWQLIKLQGAYLSGDSNELQPMTMEEMGEAIHLHESTVARAVAHKYLWCPRGLLPLRHFFTTAIGGISNQTVKQLLQQLIESENKSKPLSDQHLAQMFAERGIPCARRTIAKYRQALKLPNASQRRTWQ